MTKTGVRPTAKEIEILRKEGMKPQPSKAGAITASAKLVHSMALKHGLPKIDGLYVLDQDGEFARPS